MSVHRRSGGRTAGDHDAGHCVPLMVSLLLALGILLALDRGAQAAALARWVQYGAGGLAEVRAVTDEPNCPALAIDGKEVAMTERAAPNAEFPVRICAARLPAEARSAALRGADLPVPGRNPQRILVLGDTGCRLKLVWLQACNDPVAWPFAKNAASAASLKPDLVIHVGDYHYRETLCPPGAAGCAGSPHGDNWAAWDADFFAPAAPLLGAAPWVVVRGNHEDCERAGRGWMRLLGPGAFDAARPCIAHDPPYAILAGVLRLIVLDTATAADERIDDKAVPVYRMDFEQVRRLATGPSWLLMHRPIWGVVARDGARIIGGNRTLDAVARPLPATTELMLAGHIHALEVLNYADGLPPQLIVGNGGDDLDRRVPKALSGLAFADATITDGFSLEGFGFMLLERKGDGWQAEIRDVAGALLRRCHVGAGKIACVGG